jgi:N-acetylglucosaminyldiphosphoundecaprenol N-acetyl-beta-D-mannosaminyltransferase
MFGVPITNATMHEALALIDDLVARGRATHRSHQISTVNVDFLVNALSDPDVASILRRADVCLADGMPVVWASKLLRMPLPERVAGSDLLPLLVESSQTTRRRVHVFGSTPEVADAARDLLHQRYPRARFSIDPGPRISDPSNVDEAILDSIRRIDPDILCVALGNPKQERFIRAYRDVLGVPVLIGVGGSLDMLVGKRRRAPRWIQAIGMEWVVRAVQEPSRLGRRYARDIRVFAPALASLWHQSWRRRRSAGCELVSGAHGVRARLGDGLEASPAEFATAARLLSDGRPLEVHATTIAGDMRDDAAGQLVGLLRLARWSSAPISWRVDDESAVAAISRLGIDSVYLGVPIA